MKQFLWVVSMLLLQEVVMAGNKISGIVVDDADGSGLVTATVVLCDGGSKQIKGTTTNANGYFEIAGVEDGSYILQFSYIGYEPQAFSITQLDKDINVGGIRMLASSTTLDEVVVKGDPVIRKVDRQMVLPTSGQKKASTNGVSLLQHLQLSSLTVNPLDKSVKTNYGDEVQLRINGVEATKDEVVAIRPADVIRIEYHDNPGLRYGNVAAVVDYIVKKKETGGNVAGDFTNGISPLGYGEYHLSAKYNYKKSAVSAVMAWERRDLKWNRENNETFNYPDYTLENREIGSPTKLKYDFMNVAINYNYVNDNKSMLNIALRNQYNDTPHSFSDRNSVLYQEGKEYTIADRQKAESTIPSLDIYYQLNLKNGQHLYFDLMGTYLNSSGSRTYEMTEEGISPVEIISKTEGDKYSVIGEMIYERPLWKGKLTTGLKHNQSYTNNVYDGNISNKVKMNTEETYLFTEYQSGYKKLNYTVGVGAMRTYYKQEEAKQEKYIFRPTLTLSYNAAENLFLKYNAYMSGYAPSLSALSDVMQYIDVYQVRQGNPHLKSVTFFTNSLSASWRSRFVNVELFGRYSVDNKPIMEETIYENGKFIRTYANQKSFHRLNLQTTVQILPWKEYISISLTPFVNRYISNGNDYTHTHSNAGFKGSIIGMYQNWSMMVDMNTSYHELWGETITKGESIHTIAVGYNREKWGLQAMVMNPFTRKYEQEVVNVSKLASNRQLAYSKDFSPMFMLNFSFNIDFGKQRNSSNKRINNNADNDTGILSGSK